VLSFSLAACGYTFQGSGSVLPPDVKSVYIPLAENSTTEIGLAELVTEALRERFERFGVLRVVESSANADAILKARILALKRGSSTVTSTTDTALQIESLLTISAELKRPSGNMLWRGDRVQARKVFGTTSNVVVTSSPEFAAGSLNEGDLSGLNSREIARGQESQVLEQLAEQVARQVYNDAVAPDF